MESKTFLGLQKQHVLSETQHALFTIFNGDVKSGMWFGVPPGWHLYGLGMYG